VEVLVECVLSLGRGTTGVECDDRPGCSGEGLVFVGEESGKDKIAGVRISAGESLVREGVGKKNLVSSNTTWGVTYTCPVRGSRHKYLLGLQGVQWVRGLVVVRVNWPGHPGLPKKRHKYPLFWKLYPRKTH